MRHEGLAEFSQMQFDDTLSLWQVLDCSMLSRRVNIKCVTAGTCSFSDIVPQTSRFQSI